MRLKAYDLKHVYRKWKKGLSFFECYMRSGPFVSLQTYDDFDIENVLENNEWESKYEEILEVLYNSIEAKAFVILDLPLKVILEIGYLLDRLYGFRAVLNLNFLFHPYGIVGGKEEITRLLQCGRALQDETKPVPIMLIDSNRYGEVDEAIQKKKFNNQYELGEDDLPEEEMLKALGIRRIIWMTWDDEKADIAAYMEKMKQYFEVEKGRVNGRF